MLSVFGEIVLSCARLEGRRPGCGRNEQMARAGAVYPSRLANASRVNPTCAVKSADLG
jgi:hypothetical protein